MVSMKLKSITVVFLLASTVPALSCKPFRSSARYSQLPRSQAGREKLEAIGKVMKLEFPADTKVIGFHEITGWLDDSIYLKVQIPREEVNAFLSRSPFANIALRNDRRFVTEFPEFDWWRSEAVREYKSEQASLPDAKYLDILVDYDRKDIVDIFLVWFET
jgi:hypothetical protein